MSDDRDVFYAMFGLGFGVWGFFHGFQTFRKKQLIDDIPTSTVRGLAMGMVELTGRAGREVLLKGPLTKEDCVAYTYLIERYESSGKSGRWVTVAKGDSFQRDFFVEDDTERITVVPQGAEFICNVVFSLNNEWGTSIPSNLIDFMAGNGISYGGFFGNSTMRFTERNIKPGEQVFVLGTAKKNDNASAAQPDDVVIGLGETEKTFIISDKSQKDLDQSLGGQIVWGILGGAAAALFCLWYILTRFGIIHSF